MEKKILKKEAVKSTLGSLMDMVDDFIVAPFLHYHPDHTPPSQEVLNQSRNELINAASDALFQNGNELTINSGEEQAFVDDCLLALSSVAFDPSQKDNPYSVLANPEYNPYALLFDPDLKNKDKDELQKHFEPSIQKIFDDLDALVKDKEKLSPEKRKEAVQSLTNKMADAYFANKMDDLSNVYSGLFKMQMSMQNNSHTFSDAEIAAATLHGGASAKEGEEPLFPVLVEALAGNPTEALNQVLVDTVPSFFGHELSEEHRNEHKGVGGNPLGLEQRFEELKTELNNQLAEQPKEPHYFSPGTTPTLRPPGMIH